MTSLLRALAAALCVLFFAVPAAAHEFRPSLLELAVTDDGRVDVLWRVDNTIADSIVTPTQGGTPLGSLRPQIAVDRCHPLTEPAQQVEGDAVRSRWILDCGTRGLDGSEVSIAGLMAVQVDVMVRVRWPGGSLDEYVLRGAHNSVALVQPGGGATGRGARVLDVMRVYTVLGVEHILLGIDHLLFVLALLLLVGGGWRLLGTITGFTLGHSVTLALAASGHLSLPGPPVEALIALSIALLAGESLHARGHDESSAQRFPWAVAAAFGLLHGLGFAGALAELGLPSDRLPSALFAFNLGVELGQLAFVAVVLLVTQIGRALPATAQRGVFVATATGIGLTSGYWFAERVYGFWP